ncbi:unnamed protein product [Cylindrotheca closterium]|uniref:RNA polymerase sigma-70 domain-containing protein n=1 Tax=Cylindrotheca closterium TaxID=2856 RepID=A0AAD2FFG0_9STRA|nr:unnamed protein product [Cylindrotheca closterium]
MTLDCSSSSSSTCSASSTSSSSNRSSSTGRPTRKRALRGSGFIVASAAVALSNSYAGAFQSNSAFLPRRVMRSLDTSLRVVTDPTQLMSTDMSSDERSALEDIYLLSIEPAMSPPANAVDNEVIPPNNKRATNNSKGRKGRIVKVPKGSLSVKNVRKEGSTVGALSKTSRPRKKATKSKSSTMPGFQGGANTENQRAFKRSVRLQEERTGRKYTESSEVKNKRRADHGLKMYQSSAAVPDSMLQFAGEIHKIDRITPKEEIMLGELTQEAIRLQRIYDGLEEQLAREPTDDEWCAAAGKINMEAISQAIEEGLEAKNRLVSSNLRMVQGVVNVYIRNGLRGQYNAGDLMQEGIMALIRAAEKYDPTRGFRFSTYAMYWIRSAVKRSQIYQSRVIPVPQRLYENHKRLLRLQKEMFTELGRPPTKKELGDAMGMSEMQVDRCCAAMAQQCYSLDSPLTNPNKPTEAKSEKDTLVGLISCNTNDSDYNKLKHMFMREDLLETLNRHLSEEQVRLLMLRYGLEESIRLSKKSGTLTIAEISKEMGMKPDKVRRIINKSLKQLRTCIGDEWRDFEREYEA